MLGPKNPAWRGGRCGTDKGYMTVLRRDHPRASGRGYVYEHVLVAEAALGRDLPEKAEVHHIDGNKANNDPANLVVCEDRAYHALLHARARAVAACGNAAWRSCVYCGVYDDLANLAGRFHRQCKNAYQRENYIPSTTVRVRDTKGRYT